MRYIVKRIGVGRPVTSYALQLVSFITASVWKPTALCRLVISSSPCAELDYSIMLNQLVLCCETVSGNRLDGMLNQILS